MASLEELDTSDWSAEAIELIPIEEHEAAFGRYVLCYEIAAGGMGTVYLAREHGPAGFTRPVAIKRIHPHLARKRQFVDMFLDEARVAARIIHPNVCSVHGFGEVDGTHYIAMEYLVGQPLSEVAPRIVKRRDLAGAPAWHALAARIVADACEGLHAAHELTDEVGQPLNVVHRDVSTHNIFVTYDGAVKVLDFGIARARGRTHETRTGTVKGKLAYMSPEQARASKTIDRRSDVWSLGVVLWELLALRRLFGRRSDIELLHAVADEPIVPPSLVQPAVPPELDAIVMRALERDLEKRYPTARALARDLGAYVSKSGEATGLGELAELLAELFAQERAGKLVAVAAVMHTDTAARVVADPKPATPPPIPWAALMNEAPTIPMPSPAMDALADAPRREPYAVAEAPRSEPDAIAGEALASSSVEAAALASSSVEAAALASSSLPVAAPSRSRPPRWVLWLAVAAPSALTLLAIAVVFATTGATEEGAPREPSARPAAPAAEPIAPAPPPPSPAAQREPAVEEPSVTAPAVESERAEPGEEAAPEVPEPAEERAPVRPERDATGRVNVVATGGWADIYVRGRFVARTPHAVRLPAGEQVLELRPGGGGPPRRVSVRVRAGAATRVVVPLAAPATANPY